MTNRIKNSATTDDSNVTSKPDLNHEYENRLENHRKEVRNHVVDAQKQMSSQATAGVFDENQS
jgi:hypothetical protein